MPTVKDRETSRWSGQGLIAVALTLVIAFPPDLQAQQPVRTPGVPAELPVEIETELGPGSLKQAPLWKELVQLLQNPYAPVVRRPGFGATMPPLNVIPLDLNFLTDQPLRLRTSDGEISWDQPGPLFDPEETIQGPGGLDIDGNGTPDRLRTAIGALVASEDALLDAGDLARLGRLTREIAYCTNCGYLIVYNPTDAVARAAAGFGGTSADPRIPPNGTIVAVPAVKNGTLQELAGTSATGTVDVEELEIPINEIDFFKAARDPADSPALPFGREAAEILGKAMFWDMQVGSDGVQSCGACHFHAGVDNRTKNQLNPNHLSGDFTLQVKGPNANSDVEASDFPFHKLRNADEPGEPLLNPANVERDANDIMSSMGVVFRQFVDIPPIGASSFGPPVNGVAPLLPDIGNATADPIPVFQGLRRAEPRNTPTMHSAAFNFDNFWDGRARFHFNGGSVFGASDPTPHIFIRVGTGNAPLVGGTNGDIRPDLVADGDVKANQPIRIKFSSLASQAAGPPLSDFEMSFAGRNWAKIAKKLLQNNVTPLANQLVATDDSRLGPFSNQGGTACMSLGRPTAFGKPGLCTDYRELIRLAFKNRFWNVVNRHLNGALCADPFDGYCLTDAAGPAAVRDRNQFTQMEANFVLFFGLAVQAYEQLLIPDNTPFDQFMDANPLAANGVAQPGEQGTLPPATVRALVTGSPTGSLNLVPGFGPDELFGFDIFAGANITAALPVGNPRNPTGVGSNPFIRTARCMLCHIGPEQTDHSVNISHGLIKGGAEYELPIPPMSPEPTGPFSTVGGLILSEELEETAQDVIELEPRDMGVTDNPSTPWDERVVAVPSGFAFGDQGIYNVGVRPVNEDVGRGGDDPWGWPLAMSALALKNIGGPNFEPCDGPLDAAAHPTGCMMGNFNPAMGPAGGLFEEAGEGTAFPGSSHELSSINPGFDKTPMTPLMPPHMAPWLSDLPAGELHPQIDELGFIVNTITENAGGPAIEFGELLFGADLHCAVWSGNLAPGTPGADPPRWGALEADTGAFTDKLCPNLQSSVPGNLEDTLHGTWPFPNRVGRMGAFKAPQLRNVELTGPYFHTGSYLTLRQVVDFYLRAGDFPITNAEFRDQHMTDVSEMAFGFGATTVADDPAYAQFAGGLPDTVTRYSPMPFTAAQGATTPEYATQEDAKVALVKFLLSLTDERVAFERAPFDRPEIFVPIDGLAVDNTGGRTALLADPMFRHLPALGAGGRPDRLPSFLGISRSPVLSGAAANCAVPNNHFCR